jgi:beta-glucosidase
VRSAKQAASWNAQELTVTQTLACRAGAVTKMNRIHPVLEDGRYTPASEPVPQRTGCLKTRILEHIPAAHPVPDRQIHWEQVRRGEETLEDFVAGLNPAELDAITRGEGKMRSPLGVDGNAGILGGTTEGLREKGVPVVTTTDGPAGIRISYSASLLPCGTALACSWNPALIETLGQLFGAEMAHYGTDILLGPGMNIHRDPLCGRNFEYFSEDPHVSGKIAAAMVRGIQMNPGRSACPKHFACNNQEKMRNRNDSRLSERALREIYLKGFEICVKESAPLTIMTSYNKVNGVWCHYQYELVTDILRGEWGYDGLVITDWWMQSSADPNFPALRNDAYRIRAQVDVLMPGGKNNFSGDGDGSLVQSYLSPEGITLGEMQRCAKNVLRLCQKLGK